MNNVKHRAIGATIIVLAVAFIALAGYYLSISSQCYSNDYWWITRLPENEGIAQMAGIGLSIIVAIPLGLLMCFASISGKTGILGARVIGCAAILLLAFGIASTALGLYTVQDKLNEAKAYGSGAYSNNEAFTQETLASIQEDATEGSPWLLYIGRSDCNDCKEFESAWEKAYAKGETDYSLAVYDTTLDRNGNQAGEMRALLDSWGVESVPCVLELKGNSVVNIWENPSESLKKIEATAKTCEERPSYINAD
ncbi:MAG: hypothetical protein Q4A43_05665 [Coriobacteriia bacterium]|nr:hypothetical protein [Coriobacteriia bacterium]